MSSQRVESQLEYERALLERAIEPKAAQRIIDARIAIVQGYITDDQRC